MKTLTDHLSQYAAYHRDRRNIATHFVGIPMIVLAVVVLLARPALDVAGWPVSAATVAVIAATLYYLRLDMRLGAVMGALLLGLPVAGASHGGAVHWCVGCGGPGLVCGGLDHPVRRPHL